MINHERPDSQKNLDHLTRRDTQTALLWPSTGPCHPHARWKLPGALACKTWTPCSTRTHPIHRHGDQDDEPAEEGNHRDQARQNRGGLIIPGCTW